MNKTIFLLVIPFLMSCEKILMGPQTANDPDTNFEVLWKALDEKYPFFEQKNVDREALYATYKAQITEEMSDVELFETLNHMLMQLEDGQVQLKAPFKSGRWNWHINYQGNFDFDLIERHYFINNYDRSGPFYSAIIDSVGYLHYGDFSQDFTDHQIDFIIQKFMSLRGIIIDVRDNMGGQDNNVERLAGRFTDQKTLSLHETFKKGPEMQDFSDTVQIFNDIRGPLQFTKPIIVLTNRACFASANTFVQRMRVARHVTIMGDTTGGGSGIPIEYELPNGWEICYPSGMSLSHKKTSIDEGIAPDIRVDLLQSDKEKGKDSMLEKAIEELSK